MRRLPSLSSKRAVLPSSAPRPARRRPTGGRATSFVKASGSSDWRTWWQMRHLAALLPPSAPFSRVSSWRHAYRSLLAAAPARLFATLARSGVPARPSLPLRCGCRALPRASVGRGSLAGSLRPRAGRAASLAGLAAPTRRPGLGTRQQYIGAHGGTRRHIGAHRSRRDTHTAVPNGQMAC